MHELADFKFKCLLLAMKILRKTFIQNEKILCCVFNLLVNVIFSWNKFRSGNSDFFFFLEIKRIQHLKHFELESNVFGICIWCPDVTIKELLFLNAEGENFSGFL